MNILGFAGSGASEAVLHEWRAYIQSSRMTPTGGQAPSGQMTGVVAGVHVAEQGDCIAAIRGEIRLRANERPDSSAAQLVLDAYKQHGDKFVEYFDGSFALAIIDRIKGRVLLAVDRMGIERMTYAVKDAAIAFGTSAEQIARSPLCRFSLDTQGLYDFLMMHMIPAPNTIYKDVYKLRPGTMLVFENGRANVRPYWHPQFVESGSTERFSLWRDELHDLLAEAIRAAKPDESTGAFLSGGLDSSSVAGMYAKVAARDVHTFSIGFGVDAYDELKYARIASKHFKCQALEYDVTPQDIVTAFPLIAGAYDEPFGNSSAVPTYFCALRARERGMTRLLAGDGGDEIFGGNERYVRQGVFEHYYRLPEFARKGFIEPLSKLFPREGGLMPFRKFRSYVEQARIPMPERLESWNFIYSVGVDNMLDPDFAASIDPRAPFKFMNEVYRAAPAQSLLNKMMYYDWHYTLSDNDLRKVGTMCELAGVAVNYPLLDDRLVALSLRIPPDKKIERGQLRSFYKQAMKGFLPEEILTKQKHGFGLPFGEWLKTHTGLRDLIYSHLHGLKKRKLVRAGFIDKVIESHQGGHASYYGYAIWDLAMLEAWLQAHGTAA